MSTHSISPSKKWQDLSPWQRLSVIATIVLQIALLGAALYDIRRRPATEIRGSKRMWAAIAFVNYIGPIAYFLLGRRRPE
jgi:hypothetical protein